MFKRNIKKTLESALFRSRVILLNGARQVGKTTLMLEFVKNGYNYITFDDEISYLAAKNNPVEFISKIEKPVIIDEVQRIPEIFLPIKRTVDLNQNPGKFLLTGSANPLLIPKLGDSLAGRMEIIDIFPLSQGEINGIQEDFIDEIFGNFKIKQKLNYSKKELYTKILTGGYPSVQNVTEETFNSWMRNYLNLILQKDIKDLAQIEKITEMPNLLKILASRASGLLNVAEISRDAKMITKTTHRYLALLETIFLINIQLPWSSNLTTRFIKTPKIYFLDSGLLSYILCHPELDSGSSPLKALIDNTLMGKIVENFVVNEIRKQATWNKKEIKIYHSRTTAGQEVDLILEDRAGNIVAIEVKNSEKIISDDFKGLKFLQEKLKTKFLRGIILYTGSDVISFDKELYCVPIPALWNM